MKKSAKVEFLEELSDIISAPFPSIAKIGDIRYLFGSKEWIISFSSSFQVNRVVIIKLTGSKPLYPLCTGLQIPTDDSNILGPIGTPYNDYNFLSPPSHQAEKLMHIGLEELRDKGYKINIDLLFNKEEADRFAELSKSDEKFGIKESQMPSVYCKYTEEDNDGEGVDRKFSKKLLEQVKKQLTLEKFTMKVINASNPDFKRSFNNLLDHRRDNFFSQNKEDTVLAFSPKFDRFMKTLTDIKSIKPRCCIYELYLNNKYAASDLYFYENSYFLAYLGSFNRALSKLSPGMVLTYLTHKDLVKKHKTVTIDYTRGDEPYKFRIGGKNLTLYQLYSY